jgi:hypothetical protein
MNFGWALTMPGNFFVSVKSKQVGLSVNSLMKLSAECAIILH